MLWHLASFSHGFGSHASDGDQAGTCAKGGDSDLEFSSCWNIDNKYPSVKKQHRAIWHNYLSPILFFAIWWCHTHKSSIYKLTTHCKRELVELLFLFAIYLFCYEFWPILTCPGLQWLKITISTYMDHKWKCWIITFLLTFLIDNSTINHHAIQTKSRYTLTKYMAVSRMPCADIFRHFHPG